GRTVPAGDTRARAPAPGKPAQRPPGPSQGETDRLVPGLCGPCPDARAVLRPTRSARLQRADRRAVAACRCPDLPPGQASVVSAMLRCFLSAAAGWPGERTTRIPRPASL